MIQARGGQIVLLKLRIVFRNVMFLLGKLVIELHGKVSQQRYRPDSICHGRRGSVTARINLRHMAITVTFEVFTAVTM
jgi:hypothetical protein